MPELPEVETVRRGLLPLEGLVIRSVWTSGKPLRGRKLAADFAKRLTGHRITAIDRRAKFLLFSLSSGDRVLLHLGMSGRVMLFAPERSLPPERAAHDHLVLGFTNGAGMVFNDARRFGMLDVIPAGSDVSTHPALMHLGVEPLGGDLTAAGLLSRLSGKKVSIKAALLDQSVIAGIGNIYACEALFRAKIAPLRAAGTLTPAEGDTLIDAVRSVLREAIESGGSSLRDHFQTNGDMGYFQHRFAVYGRAGKACIRCGDSSLVKRMVQSGRSTFYCALCQT